MYMFNKDSTMIIRLSDKAWIPMDDRNRDYKEYLNWVSQGNTALPFDRNLL